MRSGMNVKRLAGWALLAAAIALSGCATKETTRTPTFVTLQTVQFDLDQVELQMEATQDALNELQNSPPQDIPQAYAVFRGSVEQLEAVGNRVVAHADGMYNYGPAYFIESEKSAVACEVPRLRYKNARRAQLGTYFDAIAENTWEVKHAYRYYDFDIRQLSDYLETILNPKGIDTVSMLFRKAQVNAASLEEALEQTLAALEKAQNAKEKSPPAGS